MAESQQQEALLHRVLAEVDEESRRQRATGSLPPRYEQELAEVFAELSPTGTGEGSLLHLSLAVVDQRAGLDPRAPISSSKPGGSALKRLIAKAIGWYVAFVVAQVERFASAVARALHLVENDLDRMRHSLAALARALPDEVVASQPTGAQWWFPVALGALRGAARPVLHADCGAGELLDALRDAGLDAYGTDRCPQTAASAAAAGHDARASSVLEELETLPQGSIGGLVLQGSVQWLGPATSARLVELAADRLAAGGTLVVVSSTPQAWERSADALVADLAPGRPLHAETWAHLMGAAGFAEVSVHRGGADPGAALRAGVGGPGEGQGRTQDAAPLPPAVATALASLLPGPDEYVVVGSTP